MKKITYYELQAEIKKVNDELKDISNSLMQEDRWKSYAEIYATPMMELPVDAKVNWSAIGEQSPEKTLAFAELLTKAAEAARDFKYNGYEVTFGEEVAA